MNSYAHLTEKPDRNACTFLSKKFLFGVQKASVPSEIVRTFSDRKQHSKTLPYLAETLAPFCIKTNRKPIIERNVQYIEQQTVNLYRTSGSETKPFFTQTYIKALNIFSTYLVPEKQESNIYKQANKIAQYVINRVNDSIKKGTRITYTSSYIDKIVTKLEWQALYAENNRQIKAKQQAHNESYEKVKGMLGKEPVKPVFYNWLEN